MGKAPINRKDLLGNIIKSLELGFNDFLGIEKRYTKNFISDLVSVAGGKQFSNPAEKKINQISYKVIYDYHDKLLGELKNPSDTITKDRLKKDFTKFIALQKDNINSLVANQFPDTIPNDLNKLYDDIISSIKDSFNQAWLKSKDKFPNVVTMTNSPKAKDNFLNRG